jgi:hypothetical protein
MTAVARAEKSLTYVPRRSVSLDVAEARRAGAVMLGVAATRPLWAGVSGVDGVPCPLRTLTGIPCPFCGMTTSICAAVGGHPGAALAANPLGVVAVIAAVVLLFTRASRWTVPAWLPAAALTAAWLFELWRFAGGGQLPAPPFPPAG